MGAIPISWEIWSFREYLWVDERRVGRIKLFPKRRNTETQKEEFFQSGGKRAQIKEGLDFKRWLFIWLGGRIVCHLQYIFR